MVVGRPRCAEKRGPRELGQDLEAERLAIEGDGALDISDVEDGMVQAAHWHGVFLHHGDPVLNTEARVAHARRAVRPQHGAPVR